MQWANFQIDQSANFNKVVPTGLWPLAQITTITIMAVPYGTLPSGLNDQYHYRRLTLHYRLLSVSGWGLLKKSPVGDGLMVKKTAHVWQSPVGDGL
jgi:hypothetical protein